MTFSHNKILAWDAEHVVKLGFQLPGTTKEKHEKETTCNHVYSRLDSNQIQHVSEKTLFNLDVSVGCAPHDSNGCQLVHFEEILQSPRRAKAKPTDFNDHRRDYPDNLDHTVSLEEIQAKLFWK